MKLPWDKKCLKISFYVVITFIAVYICKNLIDAGAFALVNLGETINEGGTVIARFFSVFSPVLMAFVIAYLLDPAVDFFQAKYENLRDGRFRDHRLKDFFARITHRKGRKKAKEPPAFKKRTAGTLITYIAILSSFFGLFWFAVSRIDSWDGSFTTGLANQINTTVNNFRDTYARIYLSLEEWGVLDYVSDYLVKFINALTTVVQNGADRVVQSITGIGGSFLNFFLAMVIAFYFLRDRDDIISKIGEFFRIILPAKLYTRFLNFFGDVHGVFSNYIRGQIMDSMIICVLISALLLFFEVKFAIIIGIISGVANVIPYLGSTLAFFLAIAAALLSGDPMKAVYSGIGLFIIQQIDGTIIGPRVVGSSVKLNPMLVIISLAVAGNLFGLVGMILAVPACAILKIFLERFMERKRLRQEIEKDVN